MTYTAGLLYDLLTRGRDYVGGCEQLRSMFVRLAPSAKTLLDVGCGVGRHLELLSQHYRVHGMDIDSSMLERAQQRVPDARFYCDDFGMFHLSTTFDIVTCLSGSLGYARDTRVLNRAIRNITMHLNPGGLLVIEPWLSPENFVEGRIVLDSYGDEAIKIARMYLTKKVDLLSVYDIDYLVGTVQGVTTFKERHELGLFTDEQYRNAMTGLGLEICDEPAGVFGYGLHVGRK